MGMNVFIESEIEELNDLFFDQLIDSSLDKSYGIILSNPKLVEAFGELCGIDLNFLGFDGGKIYTPGSEDESIPEKKYFEIDFIITTIEKFISCVKIYPNPDSLINIAGYGKYDKWVEYYTEGRFLKDLETIVKHAKRYKEAGAKKILFVFV
ncbi:MAG: hypothetical protein V4642_05460 [Bacteroidota bacterium]